MKMRLPASRCAVLRVPACKRDVTPPRWAARSTAARLPFGSVKTLAQSFNEAGYATAYVGKWHLATDHAAGINYETSAIPQERRGGYRDYWMAADVLEFTSHGYNGYVYNADNERVPFMGYRADCINNFAIDFLHGRKEQTEPFFLFISQIEPHHQNDRRRYEGPDGSRGAVCGFQPPGIWRPAQELCTGTDVSNWRKIIPIIWGAVTAWITTLDVWLIRSKSRECGKTLSLSTRRITAAIF